jgi:uncharacterized protein YigA (DUF484 family)
MDRNDNIMSACDLQAAAAANNEVTWPLLDLQMKLLSQEDLSHGEATFEVWNQNAGQVFHRYFVFNC